MAEAIYDDFSYSEDEIPQRSIAPVLKLDAEPSDSEKLRAEQSLTFLRGVLAQTSDPVVQARTMWEVAELLSNVHQDHQTAFSTLEEAFRLDPNSLVIVRAYRRAALRKNNWPQVISALEAEATLSTRSIDRAALHVARGRAFERELHQEIPARDAYLQALEADPKNTLALVAMERISRQNREMEKAAEYAQRLSEGSVDSRFGAEYLARAARCLEITKDKATALQRMAPLSAHAPRSAAVTFTLERLTAAEHNFASLIQLREAQIHHGAADPVSAWYDIGVLARYFVNEPTRAISAFNSSCNDADPASLATALAELSTLYESQESWKQVVDVDERRLFLREPGTERATLWHHIAWIREKKLEDDKGAIAAIENAIKEDPRFVPALDAGDRLYEKLGMKAQQLEVWKLQARAATTATERGHAFRRIGERLIQGSETLDDGIAALKEAFALLPQDLFTSALLERAYSQKEAWNELFEMYEQELSAHPDAARRYWLLAQIGNLTANRLKNTSRAVDSFREAIKVEAPHHVYPLMRLSQLLETHGDRGEFAQVLQQIASQLTQPAQAASFLERAALAHEERGASADAFAIYEKAVAASDPSHPVYLSAARAYARRGHHKELAKLYEVAAQKARPEEKSFWLFKSAEVHAQDLRESDEAIVRLKESLGSQPKHEASLKLLHQLLFAKQQWTELYALLEGEPVAVADMLHWANIAEASKNLDRAIDLYGKATQKGARAARWPLCRLLAQRERWSDLADRYSAMTGLGEEVAHARYRAGEIYSERLIDPKASIRMWEEASTQTAPSFSALFALPHMYADAPEKRLHTLELLETAAPEGRLCFLADRVDVLDALQDTSEALNARQELLQLRTSDPALDVEIESILEGEKNRAALGELLRRRLSDTDRAASLQAADRFTLAIVLEESSQPSQAVEYLEHPANDAHMPLLGWIALCRIQGQLRNDIGRIRGLEHLARALPNGPERAVCLKNLASYHLREGKETSAMELFEEALRSHSTDITALRELDALARKLNQPNRALDALAKAFAAESDPERLATLGTHLCSQWIQTNQNEGVHEALVRLLALSPNHLHGSMILAETQIQAQKWQEACDTLRGVISHEKATPEIRFQALEKTIVLMTSHLDKIQEAKEAARTLGELGFEDAHHLLSQLEIEELVGEYASAASTLAELIDRDDLNEEKRTQCLIRLAVLQEEKLGDSAAAIRLLGEVLAPSFEEDAAKRLLALGEKTQQWDLVSTSLEAVLDGARGGNPAWEKEMRIQLAKIFEEHLQQRGSAIRHYERVVEIDSHDLSALQRLTELASSVDKAKAIRYQREWIGHKPLRIEGYRTLRNLFLESGEEDNAFCVEAVLEGLSQANEEEAYFYRQRRAFIPATSTESITKADRKILHVQGSHPLFELLSSLQPILHKVFPVDFAGYGLSNDPEGITGPIADVANEVAVWLGVPKVRVAMVASRLGPCIESTDSPLLLLPRNLDDAVRREQQFVCGALVARAAFQGILGDPRRLNACNTKQLQYLLWAACELAAPGFRAEASGNAIFEDMKRRLDAALGNSPRSALAEAAKQLTQDPESFDLSKVFGWMNATAARAAVLCAQDPAVAIQCLRTYKGMFSVRASGDPEEWTEYLLPAMAFAVSTEHGALRRRLRFEVQR